MGQRKKKKQVHKKAKKQKIAKDKPAQNSLNWIIPLAILIITFLVFIPALQSDFVNWDDPDFVIENKLIRSLANIPTIFQNTVLGAYAPLVFTSYAIEYHLFGLNPFYYHLDNLLLHLACVFLVFKISRQLNLSLWAAGLLSLLFGIHPMRVESVAWITERKDVLYGLFYLGAIFQYIKYTQLKEKRYLYYALVLFVPALFSKIQAVALPLSFLALDYFLKRPINLKLIWEKIPFFTLSLMTGLLGIYFLSKQQIVIEGQYSILQSLVIGANSLMTYLIKWWIPYPMVTLYPYPHPEFGFTWQLYLSLPIITLFFGALFYLYKKNYRSLFFGFTFFLVNIIFVLQVVGAGQGYLADRYTYIPYFGLFFIIAYGFDTFGKSENERNYTLVKGITVLFLIGFSILTWNQNKVWKNGETLWTNAIKHFPLSVAAFQSRGDFYEQNGADDKATEDYKTALNIDPSKISIYKNYGKLLHKNGQFQAAINMFNEGIKRDANEMDFYLNRGATYASLGQFPNALQDLNKVIVKNPEETEAYLNRSNVYFVTRQFDLSIADVDVYLKENPDNGKEWFKKGLMLRAKGDLQNALTAFSQAINTDKNEASYYLERAQVYEALGDEKNSNADKAKARQ